LWRFGYDTPPNYEDNQLFCGGFNHQWSDMDGLCGVCGDPYDAPHPQDNELGGTYGQGVIADDSHYNQGALITVRVEITANHLGHFEFRVCPLNEAQDNSTEVDDATQDCLDENQLYLASGESIYQLLTSDIGDYYIDLQLPQNLTCAHCVLQWHYSTGNNWGDCGNGTTEVGCGPQETFRGCADISIM
jgi:hypothetical protein